MERNKKIIIIILHASGNKKDIRGNKNGAIGKEENMSLKIKELPESERPYEKLEMYGPRIPIKLRAISNNN